MSVSDALPLAKANSYASLCLFVSELDPESLQVSVVKKNFSGLFLYFAQFFSRLETQGMLKYMRKDAQHTRRKKESTDIGTKEGKKIQAAQLGIEPSASGLCTSALTTELSRHSR